MKLAFHFLLLAILTRAFLLSPLESTAGYTLTGDRRFTQAFPSLVINPSEVINVELDEYFSGPLLNFNLSQPVVTEQPLVS